MANSKTSLVATDRHSLRLVQQVPPGTPGAYVDGVFGQSWVASRKGLNGRGGFLGVENNPILGDASEFTITLPPVGSDGQDTRDRLYFYAGTPDPLNSGGPRIDYRPGDEWIEVIRGTNEVVAVGTPVSETSDPSQIVLRCRDVVHPSRKSQETASGFWNHAPRDVFEHYSRAWKTVVADDFAGANSRFPVFNDLATSTDGKWLYGGVNQSGGVVNPGKGVYLTAEPGFTGGFVRSAATVPDAGAVDHSCWRAEVNFSQLSAVSGGAWGAQGIALDMVDPTNTANSVYRLAMGPSNGGIYAATLTSNTAPYFTYWQINSSGLLDATGRLAPPYTLAIEARERWAYFYLDGQLVAVAGRPFVNSGSLQLQVFVNAFNSAAGDFALLDYAVLRKTTVPLNGGTPGDYRLASPPAAGGLNGEFYDTSTRGHAIAPPTQVPVQTRVDNGISFSGLAASPPAWVPGGLAAATVFYVRWTGAIYLPLATQDVHFQIPAGAWTANGLILQVGRTRKGEAACAAGPWWPGETAGLSSAGMRSTLGNVSGWYPLVVEYTWQQGAGNEPITFTYDVGGAGSQPPTSVLSPYGCFRGQIQGSHYDALKTTLAEQFVLQWKSEPRQLESGSFPGVIIPRVRVGRDTDFSLDERQAINPQSTMTAEDLADTLLAAAQGLGGNNSGTLTAEAFSFQTMGSHPFTSSETENLPATSQLAMLVLHLETLLGLRQNVWQELTADSIGQRQMQDTFPLTGALAEFDWAVGDGIRRSLPKVGVVDSTPVQIIALKRMLYPDGMGQNTASFRPRPRDFQTTMRRFIRQVYADRRAFQGQFVNMPGSRAVAPAYTEALLPADLTFVRDAQLVILSKSDASAWTINVNGAPIAAGLGSTSTVTAPGIVDLSSFVARNNMTEPRMVAQLTGGTGQVSYQLQLLTLVGSA